MRQSICQIFNKNLNLKIKDNLENQRQTLEEIQQNNNNTKFYSFVKDLGFFFFLSEDDKKERRKTRKNKGYR